MNTTVHSSGESCKERESALHPDISIRRDFLLCKPPLHIQGLAELLQGNTMELDKNAEKVYHLTIGDSSLELKPPIQYRIKFCKHIIKQLEVVGSKSAQNDKKPGDEECFDEHETCALWYGELEHLSGMEKQTEQFYRLYELKSGIVKIFESEAFVSEGTTGLVSWEASVELGNWLCGNCNNEDMLRRKWVLELGCGCGLLATAVSKTFPHLSKYYASDGSSSAVSKCKTNVEANFGNLKSDVIQVEEIDWQRDGEKFKKVVTKLSEEFEGPGLLLGADIVFDPELIPSLVVLIYDFLQHHKEAMAFIACTVRNEDTLELFKTSLDQHSLQIENIHRWGDNKGIIYKLISS